MPAAAAGGRSVLPDTTTTTTSASDTTSESRTLVSRTEIDVSLFGRLSWPLFKPQLQFLKQELQKIKIEMLLALSTYQASSTWVALGLSSFFLCSHFIFQYKLWCLYIVETLRAHVGWTAGQKKKIGRRLSSASSRCGARAPSPVVSSSSVVADSTERPGLGTVMFPDRMTDSLPI